MVIDNTPFKFIKELITRYPPLEEASDDLVISYNIIKNCFFNDKILFVCGNGGSAADSEHIVGELMKGFKMKRPVSAEFRKRLGDDAVAAKLQQGLRAISLLSHPALLSAFANDADAACVYAQQLFSLGREGDVLLGISTSGNAENVLNAFKVARAKNIKTILLTGRNKGICESFADCIVKAPSEETYRIQEYHLPLYHCLCLMLEKTFYEN